MPAGQPTKYRPEMCERVLELMAEGASIIEVAADLGVARRTIYTWKEAHEEFSHTVNMGLELCEAWWMRTGRENLDAEKFQTALWFINMKNRFGWRDKAELEVSGTVNVDISERLRMAHERVGQLAHDDGNVTDGNVIEGEASESSS